MMRICPKCGDYSVDGSATFCPVDGTPLKEINPRSDTWKEGTRVLEEKANSLRKLERKVKRRRIWSRLTITLVTLTIVFAAVANGVIVLKEHTLVYKINGQVMDAGRPIAGVEVKLEGADSLPTKTDASGKYTFNDLLEGGNYTVVPVSNGEFSFSPQTRPINNLTQDEIADFSTAVKRDFKISGRLMKDNKPVTGIEIMLAGAKYATTTTDSNGYYVFSDLPARNGYTITPVTGAKFNFTPTSRAIDDLTRDETADFSTAVEPAFTISGRVMEEKKPVPNLKIVLAGAKTATTTTDSNGYYTFSNLPARSNYTITPSTGAKIGLTPKSRSINDLTQDETADFSTVVEPAYKISGHVREERKPVPDLKIALAGAKTASTTTDSNGYYVFSNLPARNNYRVTPATGAKINFTPKARSVNNLTQDQTADFSADVERAFKISGRVMEEREPVPDLKIILSGAKADVTTTDPNGYYAFSNLPERNNYTITPATGAKINVTPKARAVNNLTQDETADFNAHVERAFKISGRVMEERKPVADIKVTLGGAKTDSATTDSNGYYSFSNLPARNSYTVAPAGSARTNFTPKSRSVNDLQQDQTADFDAMVERAFKISGRVMKERKPAADIKVTLGGAKTDSTTTDSNGYYSFSNLPARGSYFIAPASGARTNFTPKSRSVNDLQQDETADFSALIERAYKISGLVMEDRKPVADIKVTLGGAKSATAITDSNGYYAFSDLPSGGNYTITPGRSGRFTPKSRTIDDLAQDELADFSAEVKRTYQISGHVTTDRRPLGDVKIVLMGAKVDSTTTNVNGYYVFKGLPAGGTYTISTTSRIKLNPTNHPFFRLARDESADFTGVVEEALYKIKGRVMYGSEPLSEIKVTIEGSKSGSTITNANGYFTFDNLPAGGKYKITPAASYGLNFNPPNRSFTNLRRDESADFSHLRSPNPIDGPYRPPTPTPTPTGTPTTVNPIGGSAAQPSISPERPATRAGRKEPR